MFAHTISSKRLVGSLYSVGLLAAVAVLLLYPTAVVTGMNRGLSICTGVIIPTLYPFMVLAGLLTDSPLCRQPGKISQVLARRLFGLPGSCGPAIILSLLGGYPAGALAISRLLQQGQITPTQARRMTAFCVNAGPGFIVSTVGGGLLGSVQAGLLLFIAHVTVSLGIGIHLGKGHRQEKRDKATTVLPIPRPLASVVSDTCHGLLTMCGFVVLSAILLSLWEGSGVGSALARATGCPAQHLSGAVATLLEVSSGCIALFGREGAPFWLSVAMGWGGLSVHGQLAAALKGQGVLTPSFWGWRVMHGVCSGLLAQGLFWLFPISLSTSVGTPDALPYSVSAVASGMLLLLSFLAMISFSPKKAGKTE